MKKTVLILSLALCSLFSFAAKYTLVTSADDIKSGDRVIIACNSVGCVAGPLTGTNMPQVTEGVTFADDKSYVTTTGAYEYTINGGGTSWVLSNENGTIGCTAAKNALSTDPTESKYSSNWELTIDPNGDITYLCKSNSYKNTYLYFNNSAKFFANYDTKQKAVQFYKKNSTEEATIECSANLNFGQINLQDGIAIADQQFDIEGLNLTDNILLTIAEGSDNFTVSAAQLPAEGGQVIISFIAETPGEYQGSLFLQSGAIMQSVKLTAKAVEVSSLGTKDQPYACADIIAMNINDYNSMVWVEGYIMGSAATGPAVAKTVNNTSLILADTEDGANPIAVQLPSGEVRDSLNVKDNEQNIGRRVKVYGSQETYFGGPGIKRVSEYEWLDNFETAIQTVSAQAENKSLKILRNGQLIIIRNGKEYNTLGQEL